MFKLGHTYLTAGSRVLCWTQASESIARDNTSAAVQAWVRGAGVSTRLAGSSGEAGWT